VDRHAYEYIGPPLNRQRLEAVLRDRGVPDHAYNLYGSDPLDGFLMDHGPEGWTVAYTDRGMRSMVAIHPTEEAACRDFLDRFLPYLTGS
jgi:hypothetical protein